MARQITEGLEYFPFDVDFFDDPKLLLIEEEHGMVGGYVAVKLYSLIYREGYFVNWNKDMAAVFARRVGHQVTSDQVNSIVISMFRHALFSQIIYDKYGILTSRGIQKRWQRIITLSRRKAEILNIHNLINPSESELIQEVIPEKPLLDGINAEFKEPITTLIPQRKGKERKGKESKKDKGVFDPLKISLPYSSPDFVNAWSDWVNHRNSKRSKLTEEAVKRQLKTLETCDEEEAIRSIDKAISSNWSSFFPKPKEEARHSGPINPDALPESYQPPKLVW